MPAIWSEEAKLERWLAVELAALDGWAAVGVVPADAVAAIRAQRPSRRAPTRVAEIERETNHDVAAFVDAVAERLGEEGRWFHYGLTSSDVLDTALSLAVQEAGALLLEGSTARSPRSSRGREEHRDTLCIGRTHGVHAEPTTFGLKLAGWAFALERDRERLVRALDGLRVGKLSGAVGTVRGDRPRGRAGRLRAARARAGADLDPDPPARPARRAALGARARRLVARPLRDRDPPPRPHRGARGRGAVRTRPEGLVGDAAQAQPDHRRADLRARPRRARRTRSSGSRTSRSGTSATSRTPRPSASCCPTPSSPSTTCSTASPGSSRVSSCARSGCSENLWSSHGLFFSQRLLLALVESGLARDDAYRLVQRSAMRAWDEGLDFRELVAADAEVAGRVDLDGGLRPRRVHAARRRRLRAARRARRPARRRSRRVPEAVHLACGKVRELYALDDERLLLVASRPHLDLRRGPADADPRQGPRAHRPLGVLVRADARHRPQPPARAARRRPLDRVPPARDAAGRAASCAATSPARAGWTTARRARSAVMSLPAGLRESERLPEPIVTPATKAAEGHDLNITEAQAAELCGAERYAAAREAALALYALRRRALRGARDHPRRHEVRARGRRRRGRHARRRGADARLVALLAGRRLRAGRAAAVVRQAVRARLVPRHRLGSHRSRARAPRRRRRRHARPLRRGVRARDRDPVRRATSPTRRWCCEADRARPAEGRDPRSAGRGGARLARASSASPCSGARVGRLVDLELATDEPGEARAQVERMCEELLANPLIESFEIVDGDA